MQKLVPLLLACCCAGMVAPSWSADKVELRFSWWGGKARNTATLEALKAFEAKYPDITVKAEYTGWDGYYSRLTTQINSGTEADVIQTNWNWLTILSKKGDGFYDLNLVKDQLDLGQFSAESLATTRVNNKINAIPLSTNVMLFFYNAETWKKAGIDYPKNWDELLKAGQQFKSKLGDNYFPLILGEQDGLLLLRSYMYQKYQKPILDEKERKLNWTHEEWVEAFTFYQQLVDNHVIPNAKYMASFGKGVNYEMKPWINGEWAGLYSWNALYPAESQNLKAPSDLVVGPYPMMPDAKDAGQFQKTALMYSIGRSTKHPQEAALLLNFLVNDPAGVIPGGLERGAPLSKTADQALREKGILSDNDPVIGGLLQSFALPNASKASPYLEDVQFLTQFTAARDKIDYGKASVEQAVTDFEAQSNRILRRVMR
ncbi:ABC transporter substrate-binding protein [Superficieibacter sp.]|uniref:ABC transporter substrate-binding protein n=1 Tax=Superficieibacter sp. TaxID=2303322 RepID=UPI0028AFE0DD|nr:ABC transporter substrate-binding protein [Superficieibacter sp.]